MICVLLPYSKTCNIIYVINYPLIRKVKIINFFIYEGIFLYTENDLIAILTDLK